MQIHKFIIHILDKSSDCPVLNDFEGQLNEETNEFFEKHIEKALKDDELKKSIFEDYNENIIKNYCEDIIYYPDNFMENSKKIAMEFFKDIKSNSSLASCDLAVCLYSIDENYYIAILRLDYKKSFTHAIEFIDDKFNIKLIPHEVGLPSSSQKITKGAFVGISSINDDYHFEVLDKELKKENESSQIFLKNFLKASLIMDDKDKTKLFKQSTEKWIKTSLYDDIETANVIRENLQYTLKEKEDVNINDFANRVLEDVNMKENFKEYITNEGIEDDEFNIDKKWVEKKLKKKTIKTDNGFEIKGNLEDFDDYLKYSLKKNDDGSVNIIIKNIRFFEEK